MSARSARQSPVIDGLVFFCDGNPEPLRTGGVTAANITVSHWHSGLQAAFDGMAQWLERIEAPGSGWRLVRTTADIRGATEEGITGLIMGWQNVLPFEDKLERVAAFHRLGLRVAQLTYNEANPVGDGCTEERGGGLSRLGRELVARMNEVGVVIDLSHCCEATAQEAARLSRKPVLLTHANAKAVMNTIRNKTDETLRAVADSGGVVGLSIHAFMNWDGDPQRQPSLDGFIRHARHVVDLVGIEHLGIGTDFPVVQDEATTREIFERGRKSYPSVVQAFAEAFGNRLDARFPPETPSPRQFPRILEALERAGFTGAQVDAIAGGNLMRAFAASWD